MGTTRDSPPYQVPRFNSKKLAMIGNPQEIPFLQRGFWRAFLAVES